MRVPCPDRRHRAVPRTFFALPLENRPNRDKKRSAGATAMNGTLLTDAIFYFVLALGVPLLAVYGFHFIRDNFCRK